jgi:outer membrane immunogenic protein
LTTLGGSTKLDYINYLIIYWEDNLMTLRAIQKLVLITLLTLSASASADDKINWTGPYAGIDAGYTWARDSNTELETSDGAPSGYTATNKPKGGLIGINAGYNYLVNDKWLLGLGAEFKTYNANNTSEQCDGPCENYYIKSSLRNKFSLLAKAGYLVNDKTLLYLNGGWANAQFKRNYFDDDDGGIGSGDSFKSWQDGWTLGLGSEYHFYNNLTAKIEYRYTDLGSKTTYSPYFDYNEKQNAHQNEVTAGVAYHF